MICQQCGQAEAEWKVKEVLVDGPTVRWWYVCDVCLLKEYGPWIGKEIPTLSDGQVWWSKTKTTYQKTPEESGSR